MLTTRRSAGQIVFLILALIGVGISIYLTLHHYDAQKVPLACSTQGLINCENVLNSRYAVVPGTTIPISIPGLLWCLAAGGMALTLWLFRVQDRRILLAEVIWTGLGMLTVFYLVYAEATLHAICIWCTALHVLILTMLIIALVQWQGSGSDYEDEEFLAEDEEIASLPSKRS